MIIFVHISGYQIYWGQSICDAIIYCGLAEGVAATKKPRQLTRKNKTLAILTPAQQEPVTHPEKQAIEDTLALADSWSDLDWDDMIRELDHIRHASKPTPPIDLNVICLTRA